MQEWAMDGSRSAAGGDRFVELWRSGGPARLREGHAAFRELLDRAEGLAGKGRHAQAAAWCEIAGSCAVADHTGLFASRELEALVAGIARAVLGDSAIPRGSADDGRPRHILHVATRVQTIGGLARLIWRWIAADTGAVHSLALIRQRRAPPAPIVRAVRRSGGRIHDLGGRTDHLFELARGLRAAASGADLVVLHVGNPDIVPLLAFSGVSTRPPIAYLDHADHAFWTGASISDVVIGLRGSGARLAVARRGIDAERSVVLPIPLDRTGRSLPRREARRRLGLREDGLLLVSVARPLKYPSVDGRSYADAHLPFLERHRDAALVVLGSGAREDWAAARARVGDRVLGLPESEHTALHYQAADIYVDSFPFVSTTSLLEAGQFGTPLVSRFPFPDDAEILGADMPGLHGTLQRPRSTADYVEVLDRLAGDAVERDHLGEATRRGIAGTHGGEGWLAALDGVYRRTARVTPVSPDAREADRPWFGSPDLFMPFVHGGADRDMLISAQLHLMPAVPRARMALELAARRGPNFDGHLNLLKCWVPSWVMACLR